MIAVVTLILGLLVGFYVDNALVSKPRIDALSQTVEEHSTTITNLETYIETLQQTNESFQTQYDQLSAEFQQLSEEKESTITQLQSQINTLQNSVDSLETILNDKNNDIMELEDQIDTLKGKYDEINNPLFVAFTLEEIYINLSVTTDSYRDNSPINGEITIAYLNDTQFKGSFKLNLIKVYPNIGTPSEFYNLQGYKEFSWSNPFVLGAGSYKLTLSEVKDSDGNIVLPSTELRPYAIYLFLG